MDTVDLSKAKTDGRAQFMLSRRQLNFYLILVTFQEFCLFSQINLHLQRYNFNKVEA